MFDGTFFKSKDQKAADHDGKRRPTFDDHDRDYEGKMRKWTELLRNPPSTAVLTEIHGGWY